MRMTKTKVVRNLVLLASLCCVCEGEVWEKDMSEEVYIEASQEGFTEVVLSWWWKSRWRRTLMVSSIQEEAL